jgi:tetratricopeptide (TPR) repeat protein
MTYKKSLCARRACLVLLFFTAMWLAGCGDSADVRKQKFLARGLNSMREGNDEQAFYYFNQSLALDSCFSDALNNIGTVHFNGRRYAEALIYYSRAIKCNEAFLDAYFNRANTLIKTGSYQQALDDLDFILTHKPDSASAHFTRALALSSMRRYDESIKAFHRAGELDTALSMDSRINAAAVMILAKHYELAKGELLACAAIAPGESKIYNALALIHAEKHELDSALIMVNKALALEKGEPFFLNNRGYIQLIRGDLAAAEADINESMTIDPYNGWAYRNKGLLFLARNEPSEAERLLRRAIELDPYIDRVHFFLGQALSRQGKKEEACTYFNQSMLYGDSMVTDETKKCK